MLNCVDPGSESSVLITTRIRELVEGCAEVQLNLLTVDESVKLLLQTGKVEVSDAASKAAAEIAKACAYLRKPISSGSIVIIVVPQHCICRSAEESLRTTRAMILGRQRSLKSYSETALV